MATSLLYLGPCLGPYSTLVIASLGGVCMYNCYSYYGCCGVAGAAIKVTSKAANGIGGACMDGACIDRACTDRAYTDGACRDGACRGACCGA